MGEQTHFLAMVPSANIVAPVNTPTREATPFLSVQSTFPNGSQGFFQTIDFEVREKEPIQYSRAIKISLKFLLLEHLQSQTEYLYVYRGSSWGGHQNGYSINWRLSIRLGVQSKMPNLPYVIVPTSTVPMAL